jgi:hypothetical protein
MAGKALDLMTNAKLLQEIRNEFAAYSKSHPYKSFLPAGAKPPPDLNRELMNKFRDELSEIN